MNNAATHSVHTALVGALADATGLGPDVVAAQLGRPPKPEMGDYAFPCFVYAKQKSLAPHAAALQLVESLKSDRRLLELADRIEAAGPFLNVRILPGVLNASILQMVRAAGAAYGGSGVGAGKTIVIDYSGPNIAKPFHVGHLMSTILGASLVRVFRALGYTVVGVNHLGDWGVQCGFQLLAWQRAAPAERETQLAARGLEYLCDLYVDINGSAKELATLEAEFATREVLTDPEASASLRARIEALRPEAAARDAQARALFKKLEDGDPALKALPRGNAAVSSEILRPARREV
jgi:arginyl-tRNA synthetase